MGEKELKGVPTEIATAFSTGRVEFIRMFRTRMDAKWKAEDLSIEEARLSLELLTDATEMLAEELFRARALARAAMQTMEDLEQAQKGAKRHSAMVRLMFEAAATGEHPKSMLSPAEIREHYRNVAKSEEVGG